MESSHKDHFYDLKWQIIQILKKQKSCEILKKFHRISIYFKRILDLFEQIQISPGLSVLISVSSRIPVQYFDRSCIWNIKNKNQIFHSHHAQSCDRLAFFTLLFTHETQLKETRNFLSQNASLSLIPELFSGLQIP